MPKPRILIWDLETAGVNSFKSDLSSIICFGYKWLGERETHVLTIDMFPGWFSTNGLNDKPLLQAMLKIMEEADLTVAHYGDRFDKPFFHGRCILQGLTPPPLCKQRDTWYIAYKTFNFSSNRLVHLADILKVGEKKYHKKCPDEWPGWWLKVLAGNRESLRQMAKYCAQDVRTLEKVYLKLAPYDNAHPRMVADRGVCKFCGGSIVYRGKVIASEQQFRRYQCTKCGKWGRDTKAIPTDTPTGHQPKGLSRGTKGVHQQAASRGNGARRTRHDERSRKVRAIQLARKQGSR